MTPADEQERGAAARLSARLHTMIGAGGGVAGLASLRDDAAGRLGAGHEVTLAIEHTLELHRDAGRTPVESLPVWAGLRERAARSLPPRSAAGAAIRARYRSRLRACGRPGDLEVLVELCREETDPAARADLAGALRDRARFAGPDLARPESAGPEDAVPEDAGPEDAGPENPGRENPGPEVAGADLAEAIALIDEEVRRRGAGPAVDHVAVTAARRIQVDVLLALGRTRPDAAARGLSLAESLTRADDAEGGTGDELPRARVLLAEGLLLAGRVAEAGRVARLAYALHPDGFDPARALVVAARSETGRQAEATALAALRLRQAFFPPDSHYVAEARRLAEELAR